MRSTLPAEASCTELQTGVCVKKGGKGCCLLGRTQKVTGPTAHPQGNGISIPDHTGVTRACNPRVGADAGACNRRPSVCGVTAGLCAHGGVARRPGTPLQRQTDAIHQRLPTGVSHQNDKCGCVVGINQVLDESLQAKFDWCALEMR